MDRVKRVRASSAAKGPVRVRRGEIRRVARDIVARFAPRRIILFGSHAEGRARADSHVDLLVVTDARPGPDASLKMRRATSCPFPVDIIVWNQKRLRQRIRAGDFFLRDAVERGKVLYERPHR